MYNSAYNNLSVWQFPGNPDVSLASANVVVLISCKDNCLETHRGYYIPVILLKNK